MKWNNREERMLAQLLKSNRLRRQAQRAIALLCVIAMGAMMFALKLDANTIGWDEAGGPISENLEQTEEEAIASEDALWLEDVAVEDADDVLAEAGEEQAEALTEDLAAVMEDASAEEMELLLEDAMDEALPEAEEYEEGLPVFENPDAVMALPEFEPAEEETAAPEADEPAEEAAKEAEEGDAPEAETAEEEAEEGDAPQAETAEEEAPEQMDAENGTVGEEPVEVEPGETMISEDEITEDEITEEGTAEDDTSEDEATEDESAEDESAEDETDADESAEDETSEDETTWDENSEGESAEDKTAEDACAEAETAEDETIADDGDGVAAKPLDAQSVEGGDYAVTAGIYRNSGLPEGALLYADERIGDAAAACLACAEAELGALSFARFFDIGFRLDGAEVAPTGAVRLDIRLADAPEAGCLALRFTGDEAGVEIVDSASAGDGTVTFDTDCFSVFAVVAPAAPAEERPAYSAVIDVGDMAAPFSLAELLARANGGAVADIVGIDSDADVLAIDGDAVAPLRSFEQTTVTVTAADAEYRLTLRGWNAYRAQTFEGATRYIRVNVAAPEGAFPTGTVMRLRQVYDAETLSAVADTVEGGKVAVKNIYAVDITFIDPQGAEVEPLLPISVVMSLRRAEQTDGALVVHVDNAGNAAQVEETEETRHDDTAVGFESDAFSVYAFVLTEILQDTIITADGESYRITVTGGEEAGIPEGARLSVRELLAGDAGYAGYAEQAARAVRSSADALGHLRLFDISIIYDGRPIEPAAPVSVRIEYVEPVADGDSMTFDVVHFADRPEIIVPEVSGAADTVDTIAFTASSFSVYAVVGEGGTTDNARMTVNFYNGETLIATMYVKNGDSLDDLKTILYDPGVGELKKGEMFKGWSQNPQYTIEDAETGMTIDDIRTWATQQTITEGSTVDFHAMIYSTYTITYQDENGVALGTDSVLTTGAGQPAQYVVNMAYATDDTHNFEGWLAYSGGSNISGHTEGKLYENETEITVSGDVVFSVSAPEGHWLVFNENGKGATYTAPKFIKSGETTSRPRPDSEMQRLGYTFGGWYRDQACTEAFEFGGTLADNTTIYAKWTAVATAPYTVIIWKQNVAGDGYDFEESIQLTGNVDSRVNTVVQQGNGDNAYARVNGVNKQYAGFHLKEFDSNITIVPEGNAVANVYYDRTEYTLRFQVYDYTYTQTTGTSGTQYGYYNGEYVRVYYNDGTWYRTRTVGFLGGYTYSNPYTGTRYTRSNRASWQTIKEITALYEQNISENFPIVGTNGTNYAGYVWDPQNSSIFTTGQVPTLEIMPAENTVFNAMQYGTNATAHMYYYLEALPGATGDVTYDGKQYDEHQHVRININNGVNSTRSEDFYDIDGFTQYASDPVYGNDGTVGLSATNNFSIRFYYTRDSYRINYMDGVYVDGDNNRINETSHGQWSTSDEILYQADISSYNEGGADYYVPTKPGYVFEGWYIDDACTHPYTFTTMPKGGVTVYAKWRQIQYRVFLHANTVDGRLTWGSDGVSMSFRVPIGGKVSVPDGRIGDEYELLGWYTDPTCTPASLFNAEYTALNEQTVTADYDKTVDMTDTMDIFGNVNDPKSNSDLTGYNGGDRFWITKKLDLYAKWRAKLVGAEGITVHYDAGEGSNAPKDESKYLDASLTRAQAASTAPAGKKFKCWVLQMWNEEQGKYVDVAEYNPGDTFEVLKAYAKRTQNPDHTDANPSYTYTVQLRAKYMDEDAPTPTHIYWYANNGSRNVIRTNNVDGVEKEHLQINEAVPIKVPSEFESVTLGEDGFYHFTNSTGAYKFLGWARVSDANGQDKALTRDDLFLTWHEDTGTYTAVVNGQATTVSQVAADENNPYHDMYAVWERWGYLKIGKHFDVQEFYLDGVAMETRWNPLEFTIKNSSDEYITLADDPGTEAEGHFIFTGAQEGKATITLSEFVHETSPSNPHEHQYFIYAWVPVDKYTVEEDHAQADALLDGYTRQNTAYSAVATVANSCVYGELKNIGSGEARIDNNYRGNQNFACIRVNKVVDGVTLQSAYSNKDFYFIVKNDTLDAYISTDNKAFTTKPEKIQVFKMKPGGAIFYANGNQAGNPVNGNHIQVIGGNAYSAIELHAGSEPIVATAGQDPNITGYTWSHTVSAAVTPQKDDSPEKAITITNTYTRQKAKVTVKKLVNDATDTTVFPFTVTLTDTDGQTPIAGWTAYTDAEHPEDSLTTDAQGRITFNLTHNTSRELEVPVGAKLVVSEAAEGYVAEVVAQSGAEDGDADEKSFTLTVTGDDTITFTNTLRKKVAFRKVDAANAAAGLAEAEFALYRVVNNVQEDAPLYSGLVSGNDGMLAFTPGESTPQTEFELPEGTYNLVETRAPKNFSGLGDTVVPVVVGPDGVKVGTVENGYSMNGVTVSGPNEHGIVTITVTNTRKTGDFSFTKKGRDQKDAVISLKDAVFALYTEAECQNALMQGDPAAPVTATSDEDGKVEFTGIPLGIPYYMKETEAPAGYALSETVYAVALEETLVEAGEGEEATTAIVATIKPVGEGGALGEPVTEIPNTPLKVSVILEKHGDDTITGPLLANAVFDLYDSEYASDRESAVPRAKDLKTGSNGRVALGELSVGTYFLVETSAPAGYNQLTPDEAVKIEITADAEGMHVSYKQGNGTQTAAETETEGDVTTYIVKAWNKSGVSLPNTGGPGTSLYHIIGSLMAVGAALLLVKKRTA